MLRGLGRWSAEVYLMFSLQRPDVFPAGDLALQRALQKLKGWDNRPNADESRAAVAHWMPWRTVGSLFLWHFYRGAPA
jgi:DNA-3-methyladenine glycosylase II